MLPTTFYGNQKQPLNPFSRQPLECRDVFLTISEKGGLCFWMPLDVEKRGPLKKQKVER